MPNERTTFYATITSGQYPELFAIHHNIAGAYVEIRNCETERQAVAKIFALLGARWSFMYRAMEDIHTLDRNCIAILL